MEEPKGILTQMFENNDEYDQFLIEKCLFLVMDSNSSEVLKWHQKEYPTRKINPDQFTEKIFEMVQAIVKAKHQMKSYVKERDQATKDIKEVIKREGAELSRGFDKKEVISHYDAFLTQLKTALDLYAQAINGVHGTSMHAWHKGKNKEGKLISGQKVLNTLNGLPHDYIKHAKTLIKYLTSEQENIHKIVTLRDGSVHPKGIGDITPFLYNMKTKEFLPPAIITEQGNFELEAIMKNSLDFFSGFTRNAILALLSDIAPYIQPAINRETNEHFWVMTDSKNS